jgi:16S rRNA (cytosine967-C5)-methyltransferase
MARGVALEVLAAVEDDGAYANLALAATLDRHRLQARDAAAVTRWVSATLRWQGTLDLILDAAGRRASVDLDPPLRRVLRLSTAQLLLDGTPAHAAVSTGVELARRAVGRGAGTYANAVLRRVATRDLAGWVAEVAPAREEDPLGWLAVRYAHPRWVVQAFDDALAGERRRLEGVLAADNAPPLVTLAARPGRASIVDLLAAGGRPGRLARTAATLPGGNPGELPAVRAGDVAVQDEGSQAVTLAFAEATARGPAAEVERWLDLCAGPGGKAGLLAGLAAARNGSLLAVERHPHRARLVARTLRGGPGSWSVLAADGLAPPWPPATFSRVLVDAPCTGLGALRRRPEARWRHQPDDLATLVPLQRALLHAGLDAVRPGGVVGYVTCSPHLAETEGVVAAVLTERGDATVEPAGPLMPQAPDAVRGPYLQLWPDQHGTDAMFLAVLRRQV